MYGSVLISLSKTDMFDFQDIYFHPHSVQQLGTFFAALGGSAVSGICQLLHCDVVTLKHNTMFLNLYCDR